MKTLIFMLLLVSLPSRGQWHFDVSNGQSVTSTYDILFPVSYKVDLCRFELDVFDSNGLHDVNVNNDIGCGNAYWLVIDDYKYPLGNAFFYDVYTSSHFFFSIPLLGACTTVSGSAIQATTPNLVVLNNGTFSINQLSNVEYYVINNETYFSFKTVNTDIFCANGTEFINSLDLIFQGGFE